MEIAGIEPSPFGSEGYGLPYVREQQIEMILPSF